MSTASVSLSNTFLKLQEMRDGESANLGLKGAYGTDGTEIKFSTIVTGSASGGSVVSGIKATRSNTTSTQGAIVSTDDMPNSNFAVSGGDGLAIVQRKDGEGVAYTNLTDFVQKADGTYENSAGNKLLGIKYNDDGTLPSVISTNLEIVKITNNSSRPIPSTKVDVSMRIPPNLGVGVANPKFEAQVYGSLGIAHTITCTLTKTGAGAWNLTPVVTGGAVTSPVPIAVTFNNDGTLATVGGAASGDAALTLDFSAGGETNNQVVTLKLGTPGESKGLVQVGDTALVFSITPDGAPASDALTNSFDQQGVISTLFKNGTQPRKQYQIVLAKFPDSNELDNIAGTAKIQTTKSGFPSFQIPGQGSVGILEPKHLKQSNVDSTATLVKLMTTATDASLVLSAMSTSFDADKEFTKRL
ncbi:MAG: flagellar hook-basal body complex protein [Alphaproteobacteria bacterium]|nr:flagellar hook-basal body complex protein [Alphaproteobacteria bacterium]